MLPVCVTSQVSPPDIRLPSETTRDVTNVTEYIVAMLHYVLRVCENPAVTVQGVYTTYIVWGQFKVEYFKVFLLTACG
jgi:hypothetical protein